MNFVLNIFIAYFFIELCPKTLFVVIVFVSGCWVKGGLAKGHTSLCIFWMPSLGKSPNKNICTICTKLGASLLHAC